MKRGAPSDLHSPQARQLAADLEFALTKAMEAGLSPGSSVCVTAMCIGYSVANGNPSEVSMRSSLDLAFTCARLTAENDMRPIAVDGDMRVGLSEAAQQCLDELDLMDGLTDYVTAHRRALAKLSAVAEPGLPRAATANYLTHAAAFLIRTAEILLEPAPHIETPAGAAGGDAGSDPAGNAPVCREPVAPPAEPAPSRIGEEDQD